MMKSAPRTEAATVLLVDEDLEQCLNCKTKLESQGYRVVCTHSGREALAIFSCEKIDLVVADVQLPDMGGFDLIGTLASLRLPIPIVVNTSDSAFQFSFRSWAADAIIAKSPDCTELALKIAALLQAQTPQYVH